MTFSAVFSSLSISIFFRLVLIKKTKLFIDNSYFVAFKDTNSYSTKVFSFPQKIVLLQTKAMYFISIFFAFSFCCLVYRFDIRLWFNMAERIWFWNKVPFNIQPRFETEIYFFYFELLIQALYWLETWF